MISVGPGFRGFYDTGGPSSELDTGSNQMAWPRNYNPNTSPTIIGYRNNRTSSGLVDPIYGPRPPMMNTGPSRNFNPMVGSGRSVAGGAGYGGSGNPYEGSYGYGGYTGQMYGQVPNWGGFSPTIGRGATTPGLGSGNLWNTYSSLYGNGMSMNRGGMMGGGMGDRYGNMGGRRFGGGMGQGMGQTGQGGNLQNRFSNLYY